MLRAYSKVDFRNHVKDIQTGSIVQQGTYLNRKNLDHMDEAILELNEWAQNADSKVADISGINEKLQAHELEIKLLKDMLSTDIQQNQSLVIFSSLSGVRLAKGVFNEAHARIEC